LYFRNFEVCTKVRTKYPKRNSTLTRIILLLCNHKLFSSVQNEGNKVYEYLQPLILSFYVTSWKMQKGMWALRVQQ